MRHIERRGAHWRVADPDWRSPLSAVHSRLHGGRWNPAGSFGVVYLNSSLAVARAQVRQKLEPRGINPEDLDPQAGPTLIRTEIPGGRYVDAVTNAGLTSLGLPSSYPLDADGHVVAHHTCQPIGLRAHEKGEAGIACLSAAPAAPTGGEELAYFGGRRLQLRRAVAFSDWFWAS